MAPYHNRNDLVGGVVSGSVSITNAKNKRGVSIIVLTIMFMGLTPLIIRDWPQGEHAIRVILEDHKEWMATITVIENKIQKISAQLVPYTGPEQWLTKKSLSKVQSHSNTTSSLSLETQKFLEAMNKPQEEPASWTNSVWFWSLPGNRV